MKNLVIISILVLFITSCRKDTAPVTSSYTFTVGNYGSLCLICSRFYMIKDGKVYKDSSYGMARGPYTFFHSTPMPDSAYIAAQPAMNIPVYLYGHPNTTFGCPSCADGQSLCISRFNATDTLTWYIDETAPPAEIHTYITEVQSILNYLDAYH